MAKKGKTLEEIENEEGGPIKESMVGMAHNKRAARRKGTGVGGRSGAGRAGRGGAGRAGRGGGGRWRAGWFGQRSDGVLFWCCGCDGREACMRV